MSKRTALSDDTATTKKSESMEISGSLILFLSAGIIVFGGPAILLAFGGICAGANHLLQLAISSFS